MKLSVNFVLALFSICEALLRRIQRKEDDRSEKLGGQIATLRMKQATAANEALRAGRVADRIKGLTE